jgi:DNA-binding CsgD family transcriptional regulator
MALDLTPLELRILFLIAQEGLEQKEIAGRVDCKTAAVKYWIYRARIKNRCRTCAQLLFKLGLECGSN